MQILMLVGMAAELEDRVKLVSMPSRFFLKNVIGFKRPRIKTMRPYMSIMQNSAITSTPAYPKIETREALPMFSIITTTEQNTTRGIRREIIVVIVKNRLLQDSKNSCRVAVCSPINPTAAPQSELITQAGFLQSHFDKGKAVLQGLPILNGKAFLFFRNCRILFSHCPLLYFLSLPAETAGRNSPHCPVRRYIPKMSDRNNVNFIKIWIKQQGQPQEVL